MAQATESAGPAQGLGIVYLRGLIRHRRRSMRAGQKGVATVLSLPAPDPHSHPGAVEVWSPESLGQPGEEVSVKCRVSGYPRSYEKKSEDEDGVLQRVTVHTADVTLMVVA